MWGAGLILIFTSLVSLIASMKLRKILKENILFTVCFFSILGMLLTNSSFFISQISKFSYFIFSGQQSLSGSFSIIALLLILLIFKSPSKTNKSIRHSTIVFSALVSLMFVGFFSLYRDYYFRDLLSFSVFFYAGVFLIFTKFTDRRVQLVIIATILLGNISSLYSSFEFQYPLNLKTKQQFINRSK